MTNDTKNLLMQYLYRFAGHYKIPDATSISFKKRSDLMDKLKEKDNNAWVIMNNLFEAFIKSDRIQNDKEKYDRARILWEDENTEALKEKVSAEMNLIKFCKDTGITTGGIMEKEQI
jgi:hypothetical protein